MENEIENADTHLLEHAVSSLLPSHPTQAGKKFRHQKRYYRNIRCKARAFLLDLGADDWYDEWHYHVDWPGYGNLRWKHRRSHIEALCLVLSRFVQQTQNYDKPYQLWMFLHKKDAGQDAVYFCTPNPNHDNFPIKLLNTTWGLPVLEQWLAYYLPSLPLRAGMGYDTQGKVVSYCIYSPGHGIPLE